MMIWSSIFSGIIFIRHIIYITFQFSSLVVVLVVICRVGIQTRGSFYMPDDNNNIA